MNMFIEGLKYKMIISISKNFQKITLPIKNFEKLDVHVGFKGFEGSYKFTFENGSNFIFNTESIGAGGYNIQVYHFRFLTKFLNVTLSDGTKVNGSEYEIAKNFSAK